LGAMLLKASACRHCGRASEPIVSEPKKKNWWKD
jgi:hypothetical protein